jgi:hypothetical protein
VDAALDLSHTQNIGAMIKNHFKHSQFIVVSLKEGMFQNANVLFRTKFVVGGAPPPPAVPATVGVLKQCAPASVTTLTLVVLHDGCRSLYGNTDHQRRSCSVVVPLPLPVEIDIIDCRIVSAID